MKSKTEFRCPVIGCRFRGNSREIFDHCIAEKPHDIYANIFDPHKPPLPTLKMKTAGYKTHCTACAPEMRDKFTVKECVCEVFCGSEYCKGTRKE